MYNDGLSQKTITKLVVAGVIALGLIIFFWVCADIVNVQGYEVGVVHKWWGGVQDEPLANGLHIVWFGTVKKYNIGEQKLLCPLLIDQHLTAAQVDQSVINYFLGRPAWHIETNPGSDGPWFDLAQQRPKRVRS